MTKLLAALQSMKYSYKKVPVAALQESPTNPRKGFDDKYIEELAQSIALHGLLQAPEVRPLTVAGAIVPDKYEIVFGHCRVRAVGLTSLKEIEVKVVELSDVEVATRQIVENCKRKDLTPLELAEGYQRLHKERGLSVDEIALQVKKSRAAVYSAINLCDLVDVGRKAVADGKLDPSCAELIAALPGALHTELVEKALGVYGESWKQTKRKLSFREVKELIRDEYLLKLASAPFDPKDALLVARAGACTVCPKRTGVEQLELLADQGKKTADSCLDQVCYASKVAAHKRSVVSAAKAESKPVLNAGESKAALSGRYDSAWVKVTDSLSSSANGKTTVAKALQGVELEAQLAVSPSGRLVKVVKKAELQKALAAKGSKLADSNTLRHSGSERAPATKEEKEAADKRIAEREAAELLHKQVAQVAIAKVVEHIEKKGLTGDFLRLVVGRIVTSSNSRDAYQRRGLKISNHWGGELKDFHKHFSDANDREVLGMLFETCDEEITDSRQGEYSETLASACEHAGVDLAKLEAELAPKPAETELPPGLLNPINPIKWGKPVSGVAIAGKTKAGHKYKVEYNRWFGQGQGGECANLRDGMIACQARATFLAGDPKKPKSKGGGQLQAEAEGRE